MGQITRTNFGLTKTVVLSDSQIRTLPSIAVTIVPAIANAQIWPVLAILNLDWTGNYGAIDAAANIQIGVSGIVNQGAITEADGDVTGLLAAGADASAWIQLPTFPQDLSFSWGYSIATASLRNRPLEISAINGAGVSFSLGDPANTLTVTVFYCVVPVA